MDSIKSGRAVPNLGPAIRNLGFRYRIEVFCTESWLAVLNHDLLYGIVACYTEYWLTVPSLGLLYQIARESAVKRLPYLESW